MHVITEESEAADTLPLRHMFLYASSFPELIIKCFERRRKKNKKTPEKLEIAALSVLISLLKDQARFTSACITAQQGSPSSTSPTHSCTWNWSGGLFSLLL